MKLGAVLAIQIASESGGEMQEIEGTITAAAGRGLTGDRYWSSEGLFSKDGERQVTLISAPAIRAAADALGDYTGPPLEFRFTRRNLLVDLSADELEDLIGKTFTVGGATFRGTKPCNPCTKLEDRAGIPGLKDALKSRGGLCCEVVNTGTMRVDHDADIVLVT